MSSQNLRMKSVLLGVSRILRVGVFILLGHVTPSAVATSYPNVTLKSGSLAVTIYLPASLSQDDEAVFYESSRFEHGSMIGSIARRSPNGRYSNLLYGTDLWRIPHNRQWPESGVGLASEFGVGDDGDFCQYRCGWDASNDITNGVLGYEDAHNGDVFLKIGVGALIKGSCQSCDITEGYKFNSPYQFAYRPQWYMEQPSVGTLILNHEAHLKKYGYHLRKEISLGEGGNTLLVTSTLTNLGVEAFSTVWYSHHFFSCNGRTIGPGYEVDLDIARPAPGNNLYDEPGAGVWSEPLKAYASVDRDDTNDWLSISLDRFIEPGNRIKAEFEKDPKTRGSFMLKACHTKIQEDLLYDDISMYGFNLYMEDGTLSPEPQLLIHLEPSHSKSWTQRLVFDDNIDPETEEQQLDAMIMATASAIGNARKEQLEQTQWSALAMMLVLSIGSAALVMQNQRRRRYEILPNAQLSL